MPTQAWKCLEITFIIRKKLNKLSTKCLGFSQIYLRKDLQGKSSTWDVWGSLSNASQPRSQAETEAHAGKILAQQFNACSESKEKNHWSIYIEQRETGGKLWKRQPFSGILFPAYSPKSHWKGLLWGEGLTYGSGNGGTSIVHCDQDILHIRDLLFTEKCCCVVQKLVGMLAFVEIQVKAKAHIYRGKRL